MVEEEEEDDVSRSGLGIFDSPVEEGKEEGGSGGGRETVSTRDLTRARGGLLVACATLLDTIVPPVGRSMYLGCSVFSSRLWGLLSRSSLYSVLKWEGMVLEECSLATCFFMSTILQ